MAQRMIRSHTSHGIPCSANVSIKLPAISRSASGDRAVRMIAIASARCWTAQRLWSGHSDESIVLLRLSKPSTAMESSVVTRCLSFDTISSPSIILYLVTVTQLYATTLTGMVNGKG